MNSDYKIIKLVNGENIVCMVDESSFDEGYKISFPLHIKTYPVMTKKGPVEQCNLTRWGQPFTEESYFHIKPSDIILVAEASPGISAYYEQVLRLINKWDEEDMQQVEKSIKRNSRTEEETLAYFEKEEIDIGEELTAEEEIEQFEELFNESKTIH